VEFFLRYGLEKTSMTSLGAGFINYTPPGKIKAGRGSGFWHYNKAVNFERLRDIIQKCGVIL